MPRSSRRSAAYAGRIPGCSPAWPARTGDELDRARNGTPASWAGQSTHQRLFLAAAELVKLAATGKGLLLTVDDVHDADDGSLRLLHYLARSAGGQRVCIVLAHRPVPAAHALEATRRSLIDRYGAAELRLGPLADHDAAALVRRFVAEPPVELVRLVTTLGRGVPFLVAELARRAVPTAGAGPNSADGPDWASALRASMFAPLRPATREVLQRVAVAGSSFDTDEFVALSGLAEAEAFGHLDDALAAGIGHHFLAAGAGADAVPYLLRAAETESAVGAYRDALALVDAIRPHAAGPCRTRTLSLRADLLTAIGDPMAGPAYREALGGAGPADARRLRVRLANSAVMAGDLATAAAALDGLDTDGGADDADILLARGKYAFFTADFDAARIAAEQAQRLILAGERNWQVLDLVTLRGLLAHRSDQWFVQMGAELYRTREDPGMAGAIFDGYRVRPPRRSAGCAASSGRGRTVGRGVAGNGAGGRAGRGAGRGGRGRRRSRHGADPAAVGRRAVPAGRPAAGRRPVPLGADRSGRRGEQLEGDVVGVAERQPRTVARVHDLAVGHAQRVQAGRPLGQFGAARAAERHMVQAGPALVELLLAGQVRKAVQPEQGAAERVDDVPERSGVLVEDRADAEEAGVPGLTDRQIGHGHGDVRDGREGS